MRALKLLVVVMGVLLVAGIVALGFAVEYRLDHPRPPTAATAAAPAPAAATSSTLDLPDGARVVGAEASGDRLAIRVELGGGGEQVIVVDLASGRPISTITLQAKAGTP